MFTQRKMSSVSPHGIAVIKALIYLSSKLKQNHFKLLVKPQSIHFLYETGYLTICLIFCVCTRFNLRKVIFPSW